LFTGNALIVMAWASRRVSTAALLRNWALVYVGNFAGALGTAAAWPDWPESSSHFGRLMASIAKLPGPDNTTMLQAIRGAQRDFP